MNHFSINGCFFGALLFRCRQMKNQLENKNIVIIGGTTGIGLSAAKAFIGEGAKIVAIGRNPHSVAEAKRILGKNAEVLAADAFSAFEEQGIFNEKVSRRFLSSILEQGGSRDAMEAFVDFRGRKPEIEPLLKQLGLAA